MARRVNYHEASYWEERYKQNICEWYQWLVSPNQLNPLLKEKIDEGANVLELGCGSSNLAEKLTTMQHQVTALDFSKELIRNRVKSNSNQKITYKQHNILEKLPFLDGEFDVIIEKNTIDCLFCQQNFLGNVFRCMKECYRVLKDNGKMISITHGKEKNRKFFYRNRFSPFKIEVFRLGNRKANQAQVVVFVLTKSSGEGADIQEENGQNSNEQKELDASLGENNQYNQAQAEEKQEQNQAQSKEQQLNLAQNQEQSENQHKQQNENSEQHEQNQESPDNEDEYQFESLDNQELQDQ